MALGNRALKNDMPIGDDFMSDQVFKQAAKRRAMDAGKDLMSSMLPIPGVRAQQTRQRIKRATVTRRVSASKRRRKGKTGDVFDDGFYA